MYRVIPDTEIDFAAVLSSARIDLNRYNGMFSYHHNSSDCVSIMHTPCRSPKILTRKQPLYRKQHCVQQAEGLKYSRRKLTMPPKAIRLPNSVTSQAILSCSSFAPGDPGRPSSPTSPASLFAAALSRRSRGLVRRVDHGAFTPIPA